MQLFMMVRMLCAALLLGPIAAARADSWRPATPETYVSANGTVRLRVTPRAIASPLAYFEDKVKGRDRAGQARGGAEHAQATLERRGENGRWTTVWSRPLVNDVAPVKALVTNDGRHAATFDDWHSVGLGDHVVVIYGEKGALIRSLSLSDILPPDYIAGLTRSVSSLWWGTGQGFTADGSRLVLKVAVPTMRALESDESVDVLVDMTAGTIVPPVGPAWDAAYAKALTVTAEKARGEAEQQAFFRKPLLGPRSNSEPEWHQYLREAFWRLDADWEEGSAATTVLRAPEANDYKPSEKWVREALLQSDGLGGAIAIASPASPENLVRVMANIMPSIRAGALNSVPVYVAAPAAYRDRIAALLARSGARFVFLDPAVPIPQRPERLKR